MTIRYFRGGNKKQAAPLVVALGFMYIAAFHDTMVGNGLYHSIYLMEYAYLGVIVVMANSLSNKVVEAAIAKDALRKSEEWFRSLVETTSDWVWEGIKMVSIPMPARKFVSCWDMNPKKS
jgi:hypothetical protein